MDLRPQGPEIIRTWLFDTVVRARLEHGALPWTDTTINGWVLDPDRKKMSKSRGNVVTPMPLVEEYGADALRYWACNGRPGVDTAVDYGVMKVGRKLAIKVLNASKFVLGVAPDESSDDVEHVVTPVDLSLLLALAELVTEATTAFDSFDYARSLERTERFFWSFCDDYVELVKSRAYGDGGEASVRSAAVTLRIALSTLLRLLAPVLPYVTEEVWSWWQEGSVHLSAWPKTDAVRPGDADPAVYEVAAEVLAAVRKVKSTKRVSLATPVARVCVVDTEGRVAALEAARADVCDAGKIALLEIEVGPVASVRVELASEAGE
jgi:valyl-tRNA synthetase